MSFRDNQCRECGVVLKGIREFSVCLSLVRFENSVQDMSAESY
jgi:hypothetical protein